MIDVEELKEMSNDKLVETLREINVIFMVSEIEKITNFFAENKEKAKHVLKDIVTSVQFYKFMPKEYYCDYELMKEVGSVNAYMFKYLPESLQRNKQLFKEVLRVSPFAFQYAHESLRNDMELVKIAVEANGYAFNFASDEIRKNGSFIQQLMQTSLVPIESIDKSLLENKDFIKVATSHRASFLDTKLIKKETIIEVLQDNPLLFKKIHNDFKNDDDIFFTAFNLWPFTLENAPEKYQFNETVLNQLKARENEVSSKKEWFELMMRNLETIEDKKWMEENVNQVAKSPRKTKKF